VTSPSEFRGSVVAVDWSGARDTGAQRRGICVAITCADGIEVSAGRTRDETVEWIERLPAPVFVGFDFSFGFPAWFARERGCATIDDVWALAASEGETMLAPTPPFWRTRCDVPLERRFRRCEVELRAAGAPAKSIFQLVGNGQVGAGSVRGMPLLARLREHGFAIWPFDAARDRTAFEIYPSWLRRTVVDPERTYASPHERDAAESARVMWEHRESFATLPAATDPVTRIEGDVWIP
jgi:Protein of unknown function (DUF429)